MVVVVKIEHVDEFSGRRKRFRRRYPKTVAEVPGDAVFLAATQSRRGPISSPSMRRCLTEYDKIVAKTHRFARAIARASKVEGIA